MSWSFSQEQVAEFWEECFSGTVPFVLSSAMPMPDQFYWPDKPTEHSRISRFGTTCEPLTAVDGKALLMWCLEGFHAKTSALQEAGPDWTASGQGYGEKWRGLLGRFDPVTCSLKTAQLSLVEDSIECSPTLPRWGLMLDGELFPQPIPALVTSANDSGLWPTPTCDSATERKGRYAQGGLPLTAAVEQRTWPTATATASKGWSPNHNRAHTDDRLDYSVERESFQLGQKTPPMRLNPEWVEWLMGWPQDHTALKPLGMGRFQEFMRQHSPCSMGKKAMGVNKQAGIHKCP